MKNIVSKLPLALIAIGIIAVLFSASAEAYFTDTEQSTDNTLRFRIQNYLHNNPTPPTGDTNSQAVLPTDTTAPTATTLYNYDQDRDSDAGLKIVKGGSGPDEADLTKYQAWRTGSLSDDLLIIGDVTIDLWSGIDKFKLTKSGEVVIFLRDYNGSTYTEIGSGSLYEDLWQAGSGTWVMKTITISGLNYTILAGNELEVKLIVGNNAAADMWFAYDTTSYASVVKIP